MADDIVKVIADTRTDAATLQIVVNGDENTQVTSRLGESYPSVQKAIKLMTQSGLSFTAFETKSLMTASSLANGSYAIVTNDTTTNNGLHLKKSSVWSKVSYDVDERQKTYTDVAANAALVSAKTYADGVGVAAVSQLKTYTDGKKTDAVNESKFYTDNQSTATLNAAKTDATNKAESVRLSAIASAATDATTKANTALASAKTYADGVGTSAVSQLKTYTDGKKTAAVSESKFYADNQDTVTLNAAKLDATNKAESVKVSAATDATTKSNAAQTAAISAASSDATTKSSAAQTAAITAAAIDATTKASAAKDAAIIAAASDATTKANAAKTAAVSDSKTYTDTAKAAAILAASTDATAKANTAKTGAIADAEIYADIADEENLAAANAYTDTAKSAAIATAASDATAKANTTLASAKTYADTTDATNLAAAKAYTDVAKSAAISTAATDATTKSSAALALAKTYADGVGSSALSQSKTYTDTAKTSAISAAATDATAKSNTALASSKTYTDTKAGEALTKANEAADMADAVDLTIKSITSSETDRVGDAPELFSDVIKAEPDPIVLGTELYISQISKIGKVLTVKNKAGYVATRKAVPVYSGHSYSLSASLLRVVNPTDPLNDTVEVGVEWLNQAKQSISHQVIASLTLDSANGITVIDELIFPTATSAYVRAWFRIYGSDSETALIYLSANDITDAKKVTADITQSASTTLASAKTYTDTAKASAISTASADATSKVSAAQAAASLDATTKASAAQSAAISAATTDATAKANAALASSKTYADGVGSSALNQSKTYADTAAGAALSQSKTYTDTAKTSAISTAATDATTKSNAAQTSAISTAATDATTKANAAQAAAKTYSDSADVTNLASAKTYTDTAKASAISTASSDATTKANAAQAAAISTASTDATTKANAAQSAAIASSKIYSDTSDEVVLGNIKEVNKLIKTIGTSETLAFAVLDSEGNKTWIQALASDGSPPQEVVDTISEKMGFAAEAGENLFLLTDIEGYKTDIQLNTNGEIDEQVLSSWKTRMGLDSIEVEDTITKLDVANSMPSITQTESLILTSDCHHKNGELLPVMPDRYKFILIGSSSGLAIATTMAAKLKEIDIGIDLYAPAGAGHNIEHQSALFGNKPHVLTMAGNKINASGDTVVTFLDPSIVDFRTIGNMGWIKGVYGLVKTVNSTYVFSPSVAPSADVSVPEFVEFIPELGNKYRNATMLLWVGKNNLNRNIPSDDCVGSLMDNTDDMIDYNASLVKRCVVMTHWVDRGTAVVSQVRDRINECNRLYKLRYRDNVLDVESMLFDSDDIYLSVLGKTRAELDQVDRDSIAIRVLPACIAKDGTDTGHLSTAAYSYVAEKIKQFVLTKNWAGA